jgi:hypothetical protein
MPNRSVSVAALFLAVALLAPMAAGDPKKKGKSPAAASSSAAAAPTPVPVGPPSLAESLAGQAKVDHDAAKLLYSDGDFAGALIKFRSAYDQSHDARLLWNMAACEKNLRHYAKVIGLLRRYTEEGGALLTDQDRKESRDLVSTIEAFTAALSLNVSEPGAEVFVDDELIGTSPLPAPVVVDIGVRKIRVKKPGFVEVQLSFPVGGSREVSLAVPLVKEKHEGKLQVKTLSSATIFIDGQKVGKGIWSGVLPSGGHTLRVVAESMLPYQSDVLVGDNENRSVDVPLVRQAPAEEERGALHGFEIGLRTGYGWVKLDEGRYHPSDAKFVPIWLDIGYRVGRPTYLGLSISYAAYDVSGTCGVDRHGAAPSSPSDLEVRYAYTQCWHTTASVNLLFHTLPRTIVDPWFGFDAGMQMSMRTYKSYDPLTRQPAPADNHDDGGMSFMGGAQLGIDVHPWRGLGIGPWARVAMLVGNDFRNRQKDSGPTDTNVRASPFCPSYAYCSPNNNDDAGNLWLQLTFGLRAAYTFQ